MATPAHLGQLMIDMQAFGRASEADISSAMELFTTGAKTEAELIKEWKPLDGFFYLGQDHEDLMELILKQIGMRGLLVVMPRVSKWMKAAAEKVVAGLTQVDLVEVVPSKPLNPWQACTYKVIEPYNIAPCPSTYHSKFGQLHDELSSTPCFEANLRFALSKLKSVEVLNIDAALYNYDQGDDMMGDPNAGITFKELPSGIFASVGGTLKGLNINGEMTADSLVDVANTCPHLEFLHWDTSYLVAELFGEQYQMPSAMPLSDKGIAALKALRDGCPKLEWMPAVAMCFHGDVVDFYHNLRTSDSVVQAFFDFLRESPGLTKVEVENRPYNKGLVDKAIAFSLSPGSFKGLVEISAFDVEHREDGFAFEDYKRFHDEDQRDPMAQTLVDMKNLRVTIIPELMDDHGEL